MLSSDIRAARRSTSRRRDMMPMLMKYLQPRWPSRVARSFWDVTTLLMLVLLLSSSWGMARATVPSSMAGTVCGGVLGVDATVEDRGLGGCGADSFDGGRAAGMGDGSGTEGDEAGGSPRVAGWVPMHVISECHGQWGGWHRHVQTGGRWTLAASRFVATLWTRCTDVICSLRDVAPRRRRVATVDVRSACGPRGASRSDDPLSFSIGTKGKPPPTDMATQREGHGDPDCTNAGGLRGSTQRDEVGLRVVRAAGTTSILRRGRADSRMAFVVGARGDAWDCGLPALAAATTVTTSCNSLHHSLGSMRIRAWYPCWHRRRYRSHRGAPCGHDWRNGQGDCTGGRSRNSVGNTLCRNVHTAAEELRGGGSRGRHGTRRCDSLCTGVYGFADHVARQQQQGWRCGGLCLLSLCGVAHLGVDCGRMHGHNAYWTGRRSHHYVSLWMYANGSLADDIGTEGILGSRCFGFGLAYKLCRSIDPRTGRKERGGEERGDAEDVERGGGGVLGTATRHTELRALPPPSRTGRVVLVTLRCHAPLTSRCMPCI